jgi:hypothetical protein
VSLSCAKKLFVQLRSSGILLKASVNLGELEYDAPKGVMTPAVLEQIKAHKPALVAIVSGLPVPSATPGIVWDPRGGVRLEYPTDPREMCLLLAANAHFPRLSLPHRKAEIVLGGAEGWRLFSERADLVDVLHACCALDTNSHPRVERTNE